MNRWKRSLFTLAVIALSSIGAHAQSGITAQNGRQVTCASDDGRRHLCRVNTRFGVQMVNQRSGSACVQGQTWDFNRKGIWVDRGCRADFWLGGGWGRNGGDRRDDPDRRGDADRGGDGVKVTCSSDDGRRNFCNVDTRAGVRMLSQRSGSACIQGQTWGYNGQSIWVDRGCRADFIVGGR